MAQHSNDKLLALLTDAPDYQENAISAAISELKTRNVSAFDIEEALDAAKEKAFALTQTRDISMGILEKAFWLCLPMLTFSPIGAWKFSQYSQSGYQRKARQILELGVMGLTIYMISWLTIWPLFLMVWN